MNNGSIVNFLLDLKQLDLSFSGFTFYYYDNGNINGWKDNLNFREVRELNDYPNEDTSIYFYNIKST